MTDLIEKVAREIDDKWQCYHSECEGNLDDAARAAIAVVLKELYRKGSWLHLDRTLDLVEEMARENGIEL